MNLLIRIKLMQIEKHLFNCDDCKKAISEEYELIKFLNNWSIDSHAQTVKFHDFIKNLENIKKDSIYKTNEDLKELIDRILKPDFNYLNRGFEEYIENRTSKTLMDFSKFFTLDIDFADEFLEKKHIYTNNDILEDISIVFEDNTLMIRNNFKKGGKTKDVFLLLLSDDEEDDYFKIEELKTPDTDAKFQETIFENLIPGTYHLFVETLDQET